MSIIHQLLSARPVVTDGAWGTQLQRRGLAGGACADAWNLTAPEAVEQVARAYVEVGSQIILTNTFRANRLALAAHGLADDTVAINQAGLAISRRAAGDRARVFASIGPSGKMLLSGDTSETELGDVFGEQAAALAGADALVIETMADLAEARIALSAARQTGLPIVVSMVFDSGKQRDRTMMGATPEEVARELTAAGADVIGANCGQGPEGYFDICRRLRSASHLPLWMKPNAGAPALVEDQATYRTTPEEFAAATWQLVECGADFLGGCCGTHPDFIQALVERSRKN